MKGNAIVTAVKLLWIKQLPVALYLHAAHCPKVMDVVYDVWVVGKTQLIIITNSRRRRHGTCSDGNMILYYYHRYVKSGHHLQPPVALSKYDKQVVLLFF